MKEMRNEDDQRDGVKPGLTSFITTPVINSLNDDSSYEQKTQIQVQTEVKSSTWSCPVQRLTFRGRNKIYCI